MKYHNLWISPTGKIIDIYDNYDENNCHNDWANDYIQDRVQPGWDIRHKVRHAYQYLEKQGWRRVTHWAGRKPVIPSLLNKIQEEKIINYELEHNVKFIREA